MSAPDPLFPHLVSLACHDLRTPLATVQGFAKTLQRVELSPEQTERYVGMIDAASGELAELLDHLAVAARIEGDRYEPVRREVDSLALATAAAERLGGKAAVDGAGATVEVDADGVERALAGIARCALRHGGLEAVALSVAGAEVAVGPVDDAVARIALGEELHDLQAAVGVRLVRALGGSVERAGDRLLVSLPAPG